MQHFLCCPASRGGQNNALEWTKLECNKQNTLL